MIAIETLDGSLVKIFQGHGEREIGFHPFFGFISTDKGKVNEQVKKRQGFQLHWGQWSCTFKVKSSSEGLELVAGQDCQWEKLNQDYWLLQTPMGQFRVGQNKAPVLVPVGTEVLPDQRLLNFLLFAALIATGAIILFLALRPVPEAVLIEEQVLEEEPIIVKIVKPAVTVNVGEVTSQSINKVITKKSDSMKNLGFLGLIGDKNLKTKVNGAPTKLTKASAGAGPGGEQGSGGESLIGLGEGLKKTTVGNTGVAGLGGIGTKGAGGGKGGYGNSLVASGNGKGLQEVSITNSAMVLEGGLSKFVINATIAKYLSQVRRCYEDELKTNPSLEGLVNVDFEVGPSGKLNFAKTGKSTLDNKTVENCINERMMTWTFPQPKGGVNVKVSYPFMLRPVGQD